MFTLIIKACSHHVGSWPRLVGSSRQTRRRPPRSRPPREGSNSCPPAAFLQWRISLWAGRSPGRSCGEPRGSPQRSWWSRCRRCPEARPIVIRCCFQSHRWSSGSMAHLVCLEINNRMINDTVNIIKIIFNCFNENISSDTLTKYGEVILILTKILKIDVCNGTFCAILLQWICTFFKWCMNVCEIVWIKE